MLREVSDVSQYTLHKPSQTREYNSDDERNTEPVSFIKYKINNKPKADMRSPSSSFEWNHNEGIGIKHPPRITFR